MLQISAKEIESRLRFDNPWWESRDGIDPHVEQYPRRFYFDIFFGLLANRNVNRAVVLMGPRRVGKTVMVFHAIGKLIRDGVKADKILYLSLETPLYTGMSLEHLVQLFQKIHGHRREDELYIFFDEVQYLKDWEVHLKSLVDSFSAYQFIVTGSSAAALRLKSSESGAGRFTDFLLPPLTFAEYLTFIKRDAELIDEHTNPNTPVIEYVAKDITALNIEFVNYLNYGGYPEAVFSDTIRADTARYIKSDIIDKVLLRDLPSLYGISDIQELNKLFTTLAYNTGNEISLENLSQSAGVVKNTLKRYLEYLEAAFLIKRVYRIDQNARHFKRVTSFKVYLTNPSMRAALFGPIAIDADGMGALTETAIYSQWWHTPTDFLYYARWPEGEVDIVSLDSKNQKPTWIVEVKWSDRPCEHHELLAHCVSFAHVNKLKNGPLVTTRTQHGETEIDGVKIRFRPSSEYAYTLGKNILRHKLLAGAGAAKD